ncbi:MAG: tol-pal system protein YbgF [Propylenella sp.]
MMRLSAVLLCLFLAAPAAAQTQEEGQMRLYIQDLENRVRQLTGENERLFYELNQMRAQLGMPPLLPNEPAATGAVVTGEAVQPPAGVAPGAEQTLGTLPVSPEAPLVPPQGAGAEAPVDLSALAGGVAPEMVKPEFGNPTPPGQPGAIPPGQPGGAEIAGLPAAPGTPPAAALSGSAADEYDLAYGYILTGDYDLAEESFRTWLAAFPGNPQEADAQFWLGESHLQQGEYRDAANSFLAVYKAAPESKKGPDALLKLGVSLSALGEGTAACATFAEVGRKYPSAPASLMSRVHDEEGRAGC